MNYSPQQLQRQRQMKKTTNNTVLPELVSKNLYRPMTTVLGAEEGWGNWDRARQSLCETFCMPRQTDM